MYSENQIEVHPIQREIFFDECIKLFLPEVGLLKAPIVSACASYILYEAFSVTVFIFTWVNLKKGRFE